MPYVKPCLRRPVAHRLIADRRCLKSGALTRAEMDMCRADAGGSGGIRTACRRSSDDIMAAQKRREAAIRSEMITAGAAPRGATTTYFEQQSGDGPRWHHWRRHLLNQVSVPTRHMPIGSHPWRVRAVTVDHFGGACSNSSRPAGVRSRSCEDRRGPATAFGQLGARSWISRTGSLLARLPRARSRLLHRARTRRHEASVPRFHDRRSPWSPR